MVTLRADLCVVGGGPAAQALAAGAVRMGARAVVLAGEGGARQDHDGPLLAALVAAGKAVQARRRPCFGLQAQDQAADHAGIVDCLRAAIDRAERCESLEDLGVRVIPARGRFTGLAEMQAGDHLIRARRFVIATDTGLALPSLPGLEAVPFLTSATLPALCKRPGHLLILGAGRSGVAIAQACRRLGSRVTLIDSGQALNGEDPQAVALVTRALRNDGVEVIERARPEQVGGRPGAIELRVAGGTVFIGTHLLLATGRRPDLTGLGLDAAGIKHGPDGIETDARLRSTNRRVFAIDAATIRQRGFPLDHQVQVVLRAALLGLPVWLRDHRITRVIHADPALAQAGLAEAKARARHGAALRVITLPLGGNDANRASAGDEPASGFIKLIAHRDRLVGVTIAAPDAERMIDLWVLILAQGTRLSALLAPTGKVLPNLPGATLIKRALDPYFSPAVFDNTLVKRVIGLVQRVLP